MPQAKITIGEQVLTLDLPLSLRISESRYLKRNTGLTEAELLGQFDARDPDAVAYVLWLLNQRAGTPLQSGFLDIDLDMGTIATELIEDDAPEVATAGPTSPDGTATSTPTSEQPDPPSSTSTE